MAYVAPTCGISGEMIRDLMLTCVERRFAALWALHPVQWLADNGSAYTAHDTRDFAVALILDACFTRVGIPRKQRGQRGVRVDTQVRLRPHPPSP